MVATEVMTEIMVMRFVCVKKGGLPGRIYVICAWFFEGTALALSLVPLAGTGWTGMDGGGDWRGDGRGGLDWTGLEGRRRRDGSGAGLDSIRLNEFNSFDRFDSSLDFRAAVAGRRLPCPIDPTNPTAT